MNNSSKNIFFNFHLYTDDIGVREKEKKKRTKHFIYQQFWPLIFNHEIKFSVRVNFCKVIKINNQITKTILN